MKSHARVVVIGGGAMGCSLVYHLTKLGWSDVVLVEKNELTAGSTWHAAGLCTHFAHNLTVMHMRAHSVRLYGGELSADTGLPVGFHPCGALRVTRSADRLDEFRHVQGLGRYAGLDFNILTPAELKKVHPLARTDDVLAAFHEPLDGFVDPAQATQAMAAGARSRGAEVYRHNPVMSLKRNAAGDWLAETRDGTITAEIVVNAAGTWAREIGTMMGLDLPVVPMLHQYLVTEDVEAVKALATELPIIRDPEESWYARQEGKGFIVGPYERQGQPWSVDGVPPAFGMELLPPDLDRVAPIVEKAMARVPAIASAGIKTVVNGPITFTPDAGPLIGPAPGLDRAWLMTGSSMGVMEGGGAGRFLAEWMVGGEPPMDPLALDPRRFGAYADRDYRLAKAVESFGRQFAIHYPFEELPAGRDRIKSPIHDALAKAGAQFGAVYGQERPNWFARRKDALPVAPTFRRPGWLEAVGEECENLTTRAGLADLSAFSKFEVKGKGAADFMETLGSNHAPRRDGRIGLTLALTPSGGIISEFTVTRLSADHFYLTSAAAARRQDHDLLSTHAREHAGAEVSEVSEQRGVIALMGPRAPKILKGLTDAGTGVKAFPWLTAQKLRVAGVEVLALRVSYAGEAGFELHSARADQPKLYAALMEAGRHLGLGHFGAYALNAMRLEKGYRAWGLDYTTERTPLEAGVEHLVDTEGRRFCGRTGLAASRPNAMRLRLIEIFEADNPEAKNEKQETSGLPVYPFYGHTVLAAGKPVGMVTSAAFGHRTQKHLALAYLDAAVGSDAALEVLVLGNAAPARTLSEPPYDAANHRLRLDPDA